MLNCIWFLCLVTIKFSVYSLQSNFTRIEEMASGAAYCQLTELLFPGKISLKKVKWNSRSEVDWIANWRMLQTAWKDLGVKKVSVENN